MTITQGAGKFGLATVSRWHISSLFKRCRKALQERREGQKLRAILHGMQDRELKDLGITRSEIEYAALNVSIDPRGNRSAD
jgi:uncharacterized protein YjiS (DUF1127 family)